ncbi:uncharacterized protein LOC119906089 [Micropterus salmoides]|uniref:uncharacterized protein LOC119906089 n=1 Tax=Micropterus salmoides TaxID=27706 RepID=UPI0018EAAA56|nr:uncharacterized protein LOC119906089 [Micropterus salmoides]
MHNWQENEIKELLTIRGSEAIRNQITGTVKDSVVYNRMTKLLAERGVYRSHMQVISKLKALRKQYTKYHQQKTRCGSDRVDWPFYEQCHRVFGNASAGNPVKRQRSPTPPPAPSPPPPSPPPPEEVVVGLWDDVDDKEINKHLGPVEAEDDDEYSPSEQLQSINAILIIVHSVVMRWRTAACLSQSNLAVMTIKLIESGGDPQTVSIYSSIEEKENNSDGASLYFSVSNSRTAQRDGRFHAGAGGCPATKVDGP